MGRGPFKPGLTLRWFQGRTEEEAEALAAFPQALVWKALRTLPGESWHVFYGCADAGELRRWFLPAEYDWLRAHGYRAVRLEADLLLHAGPAQSLYARRQPLRGAGDAYDLYP